MSESETFYYIPSAIIVLQSFDTKTDVFWPKKAKNAMKNHILKPLTFTLIMFSSMQTVEIPQKLTIVLIILVDFFLTFTWAGKNDEKRGFNNFYFKSIKNICSHQ